VIDKASGSLAFCPTIRDRVRRGSEPPDDIATVIRAWQTEQPSRWARVPVTDHTGVPGLEVALRRERSSPLIDAVRQATLNLVILRETKPVGVMSFDEYRIVRPLTDSKFFDELDSYRFRARALAMALLANWPARVLADTSTSRRIASFERLWVWPRPEAVNCWPVAARAIIEYRYLRRYGLIVLCPFPLEYEGVGSRIGAAESAFDHRRRAMVRLYTRQLGVIPLPGRPDPDRIFMWRPLRNDTPRPKVRRPRLS
jgi:hypothetical protein